MSKKNKTVKKIYGKSNVGIVDGVFSYQGTLTLDQFAKRSQIPANEIIKSFLMQGKLVSLNDILTDEQITEICLEHDLDAKKESIVAGEDDFTSIPVYDDKDDISRAPVVTIMGHVDHGKTTLIDTIRSSNITMGEAGGITQSIGAYQKTLKDKKITFLDTPGHEAFTEMRRRGASVTDIIILVVAADDGVKPQTIEAISHANAAKVPIIVACNKCDKEGADVNKVKSELSRNGIMIEEWGGETMFYEISAKNNKGINELLDGVITLAEILELKANESKKAIGSVIEAELDKREGPKATLLVQNGTLHEGDYLAVGSHYCKVRRMTNEFNKIVKSAGPSTPVSVIGFSGVPLSGDRFLVFDSEAEAKKAAEFKANQSSDGITLNKLSNNQEGEVNLNLVVKTDTIGSSEAIKASLEKIHVEGANLSIVHISSGDVTQGDVILASASKAIIIAFNVKINAQIKDVAKEEDVEIRYYDIIYKLLEDIEAALKGKLGPEYEEVVHGHMEVRSLFKASKVGQIIGCYVTDGKIKSSDKIRVYREGEMIKETKLSSLKRFKDDVKEVKESFECGATIVDNFVLKEKDILEAYDLEEVK